jgi:GrpB-like predicted nucleotidyltransferase (UPF0157 family)
MKVHLEPHNPAWAVHFSKIRDDLQDIFKDIPILSIEHVGSTSIPNLLAKPVLDIDIVVPATSLPPARLALVSAGYTDLGEMGVTDRIALRQPGNPHWKTNAPGPREGVSWEEEMRRNVYVVVEGSVALRNHRDLKRVLMEDGELRERYGEVKRGFLERMGGEVESLREYTITKNGIMIEILRKAGWGEELEEVRRANDGGRGVRVSGVSTTAS